MGTKFDITAAIRKQMQPASPERTIEVITDEILTCKVRAGEAILQIGRCLIEAKELLPHGEWLPWLEEQVEYSERTAQNFMRLTREYSNPQTLADLGASKALQLLALPPEEREVFAAEEHVVNGEEKTAAEMTSRELAQAIQEREQALADKRNAEQSRAKMEEDMKAANLRLEAAQHEKDEAAAREALLRKELEELRARPIEVTGAAVPDAAALDAAREEGASQARKEAEEKLKAKLEKAKTASASAAEKLKQAQDEAQETAQALTQECDALKVRNEELERKLKIADSQDMATFAVHFESVKEDWNRMLGCLAKLKGAGRAEEHDKLVDALHGLAQALGQSVPGKVGGQNA